MTEDQVAAARAKSFPYPGIPTTCDGADAVVHVEINVTQGAGAFPITSSTTMGGGYNAAVMSTPRRASVKASRRRAGGLPTSLPVRASS